MPTTSLKRTAATIGVLASVLAAAAPANATPDVGPRGNDHSTIHMKAPAPSGEVLSALAYSNMGYSYVKAPGTQVGSEGLITYNGHAGLGSNSLA